MYTDTNAFESPRETVKLGVALGFGAAMGIVGIGLGFILNTGGHEPTPREAQQAAYQERMIQQTLVTRMSQTDLPEDCHVIGVWEDGSLVAHCPFVDLTITEGPDADDTWMPYDGKLSDTWESRRLDVELASS